MPAKDGNGSHCSAVDERGELPFLFVRTTGKGICGSKGISELTARKQKLFPCSGNRHRVPAAHMPLSGRTGVEEPSEEKCGVSLKDSFSVCGRSPGNLPGKPVFVFTNCIFSICLFNLYHILTCFMPLSRCTVSPGPVKRQHSFP